MTARNTSDYVWQRGVKGVSGVAFNAQQHARISGKAARHWIVRGEADKAAARAREAFSAAIRYLKALGR